MKLCEQCGHIFAPHIVVAEEFDTVLGVDNVPVAGHIFCLEEDCSCSSTWSLKRPKESNGQTPNP